MTQPVVWLNVARRALEHTLKGAELEAEVERLRHDVKRLDLFNHQSKEDTDAGFKGQQSYD